MISQTLQKTLSAHFSRYPAMQMQDLYKLLHQAALGSEHAVNDEASARTWLARELAEMGGGPEEPLLDPLSPDGGIVRVHLRPYLRAKKDPQSLLTAFLRTANEWRGSRETLQAFGQAAAGLAEDENWPLRGAEIETFFAAMAGMDFPAVHHSETYSTLYRPAYRVVAGKFLEEA